MENKKNKKKGILWYVLAFVLTALIYVIVIWLKDAYPFGDKCVCMRMPMYSTIQCLGH